MVKRIFSTMIALMMVLTVISFVPQTASADTVFPTNPRTDSKGKVTWDCVYFGHYLQTSAGNGKFKNEPIKWRVLSVNGNDAFLMADKALDYKKYNETKKLKMTWEKSTLRSWLNGYDSTQNTNGKNYTTSNFINKAFTETEQNAIIETKVTNPKHPYYGTSGGNDTTDKIYLLSFAEAKKSAYGFPANNECAAMRTCNYTSYVKKQDTMGQLEYPDHSGLDYKGNANWWLRSPADSDSDFAIDEKTSRAAGIDFLGGLAYEYSDDFYYGTNVEDTMAVRPVLHLNLSSNEWSNAGTVSADKTQKIKIVSSVKKPYSTQGISLDFGAKTPFSYKIGNTKVAGVGQVVLLDYIKLWLNSPGKTTLTITAPATKNFNSAKKVVNITVLPRKMSAPTVKSSKTKTLTANWKKNSKVTGYKVVIARDKNFKTGVKTFTTTKNTTTSVTFIKLVPKKTYYVKMRAYKKWGTEKLYGDYSTVKRITIK